MSIAVSRIPPIAAENGASEPQGATGGLSASVGRARADELPAVPAVPAVPISPGDASAQAAGPGWGQPGSDACGSGAVHRWFSKVMEQDGPGILRLLWRLLGNEPDVLDAYQECWCLLAQLGQPRNIRNVKGYVYRTASNVAIEVIRRRKRRQGHWAAVVDHYRRQGDRGTSDSGTASKVGPTNEDADEAATIDAMREMMGELPPHLRNVLVLRDLTSMSYKEVGKVLGIEPTTARVYRRQAVLKLADLMREDPS